MPNPTLPTLLLFSAFSLISPTQAALLFYEGFSADDYTEGSVFDQAQVLPGYAEGGTWNSTSSFVVGGLEHAVLQTTPGFHFARTAGENPTPLDLTPEGPFGAAGLIGDNNLIGGTGVTTPIYFSVLARKDDEGTLDGFAGFQVYDGTQGAAGEGIGPGEVGQPNYKWLQGGSNNDIGIGTILASGETRFFVVKLDYEIAPMEATLWIDPDITQIEEEQSPDSLTVVPNARPAEGFDSFRLRGNRNWSFDEIRFGTTWESVTPRVVSTTLAITAFAYAPAEQSVTLTWSSRPDETYAVKVSTDLLDWSATLQAGIAPGSDDSTTLEFSLSDLPGSVQEDVSSLYFRVEVE